MSSLVWLLIWLVSIFYVAIWESASFPSDFGYALEIAIVLAAQTGTPLGRRIGIIDRESHPVALRKKASPPPEDTNGPDLVRSALRPEQPYLPGFKHEPT